MKIQGLYLKKNRYYWQPPQKCGLRPKPIALRTSDADEAVKKVFELQQSALLDQSANAGRMEPEIKVYLETKKSSGSHTERTRKTATVVLGNLCKHWENPMLPSITEKKIIAWREWLSKQPGRKGQLMSDSSIGGYLRILKGFLSWCYRTGRIPVHPMRDFKMGRIKRTKRQDFCSYEQRDLLLANAPSEEIDFILHIGFFAGLRFGEMLAMEPNWLFLSPDGSHGNLTVQETAFWKPKDKELRTIPLHPRLLEFFARYGVRKPFMLAPKKDEWKAPPAYRFNPKKQLAGLTRRCEMEFVTYHTLRHSFATHLAMENVPMREIAALLGDDIRVVEEHYVGFSPVAGDVISKLRS